MALTPTLPAVVLELGEGLGVRVIELFGRLKLLKNAQNGVIAAESIPQQFKQCPFTAKIDLKLKQFLSPYSLFDLTPHLSIITAIFVLIKLFC
jgi:hypothetical protein